MRFLVAQILRLPVCRVGLHEFMIMRLMAAQNLRLPVCRVGLRQLEIMHFTNAQALHLPVCRAELRVSHLTPLIAAQVSLRLVAAARLERWETIRLLEAVLIQWCWHPLVFRI